MSLTASVLDESGALFIEASRSGPADRPRELGRAVGLELLAKGAADIIERSRPVVVSPDTPAPAAASARHARSAFPAGCRGRD